jgi:biotin transport system ATP-binding protein
LLTRTDHNRDLDAGVCIEQVSLRRGSRTVFDGLNLRLTERRIGLIGDNGSGKSSLLRLINGLLLPDAGSVRTFGLDTRANRAELPGKAGFLFQNAEHQILFPTIGEELIFGLRENGMTDAAANARMHAVLAAHGWDDWAMRPVQELSDGQKQRLCIMAVLAMEPAILLLDEPFASLDLPSRRRLSVEIAQLPQQVVMASHDFDLFDGFDRIVWLDRGRIVGDGPPLEVIGRYRDAAMPDREKALAP